MKIFKILFILNLFSSMLPNKSVNGFPVPFDQHSYMIARNQIKKIDSLDLKEISEKERIVGIYFGKLKSDEFKRTRKRFHGSESIETEYNSIKKSDLFSKLKLLPKGGNLHIHENQMLDRRYLLEMIKNTTEYDLLYICDKDAKPFCRTNQCSCNNYFLTYFKKLNNLNTDGWVKVKDSNWTIDSIVAKTTLIGLINNLDAKISLTDSSERWKVANNVFSIYSDIIKYNKTRFEYLKACLDKSLEENVQLIEFRRSFFKGLYYFDEDGNRVHLSLNYEIETIEKFKNEYLEKNPNFIDFNYILYGSRWKSKEEIKENVENVLNLQRHYQNFIRGFDLVGEEDIGHSLLFHSDALIQGLNYSLNSNESFKYYFHTGETNWPTDIYTSEYSEDSSTDDNVFDAILFKTKRIGHGLAYFKHPNLYPYLKNNKIAIETCPASNQILGFVPDIRNHPAINFYKSGIPIVLAGDDPGSFGYNDLTVDYYLAFMSWGLSLYDLREIANNSIKYSSIGDSVKLIGYEKFSRLWKRQIDYFYNQICQNFTEKYTNMTNKYSLIGKSYGPIYSTVYLVINSDLPENMLCKTVSCFFNETETSGYFKKSNQIACSTTGFKANDFTYISIRIGDYKMSTGLNYTFILNNKLSLGFYNSKSPRTSFEFFFIFQILLNIFI